MKVFLTVLVALLTLHCKTSENPVTLKGRSSFQLADGSPISLASSDEYNPYLVKMSDGYLMLVFGSDRACSGCTAGAHNIFIARSVAAYANDAKLPYFNAPAVFTVNSSALNYATAINFTAAKNGSNVRIHLNNSAGIVQYADVSPTNINFNVASLTAITNSLWRRLTLLGTDNSGSLLFGRSSAGLVYLMDPAVINITLTAASLDSNTQSIVHLATAQSAISDGYFVLAGGSATAATFSASGSSMKDINAAISRAGVVPKQIGLLQTGLAQGDLILVAGIEAGQAKSDIFVVENTTAAAQWAALSSKPNSTGAVVTAAVSGLYAWYELDGNRNDSSGSANNAYLPTAPFSGADPAYTATDRHGQSNAAATFNGTTHYIGNNFQGKCDESFSVSMWIKPAQVAAQKSLVGYQTSPAANPGFTLNTEAGGGLAAQSFFNGTGANTANTYGASATALLPVGQWRHLIYVNDSATRLGTIYLNGVVVATTAHAGSDCPALGGPCTCSGVSPVTGQQQWWSATPLTIGYGYRGFYSGELDQVAFFSRKLTAAEIQVLATQ